MGTPHPAVRAGLRGGYKVGRFLNRPQMCKLEGREGENLYREMKGRGDRTKNGGDGVGGGRRGKEAETGSRVTREEKCLGWEDWDHQDGVSVLNSLCAGQG